MRSRGCATSSTIDFQTFFTPRGNPEPIKAVASQFPSPCPWHPPVGGDFHNCLFWLVFHPHVFLPRLLRINTVSWLCVPDSVAENCGGWIWNGVSTVLGDLLRLSAPRFTRECLGVPIDDTGPSVATFVCRLLSSTLKRAREPSPIKDTRVSFLTQSSRN